jgi:hypothetical protein
MPRRTSGGAITGTMEVGGDGYVRQRSYELLTGGGGHPADMLDVRSRVVGVRANMGSLPRITGDFYPNSFLSGVRVGGAPQMDINGKRN